jgi:3-hydroxyisobutyrate dehydrogenase-like beta-hydroxyacid dehydrogenase
MNDAPIGLIGLGLVGRALAQRLQAAGKQVLGWDLQAPAREAFSSGRVAASPQEIGQACETVLLAIYETRDVLALVADAQGLLAPGHGVRCLIDCSTGDPDLLQALAAGLAERGITLLEAPLSGSSEQIAAGQASMLLGGPDEAVAAQDGLLALLSDTRIHLGPAGMGARAKLATNLVLGLNRAALAEGMVFAESLGIEPQRFLDLVLATPARSEAAKVKGPLMVAQRFEPPQSRIRQHLKDLDLMLAQAERGGLDMPLSQAHAAILRAAVDAGDGELDNAAIVQQLRRMRQAPSS